MFGPPAEHFGIGNDGDIFYFNVGFYNRNTDNNRYKEIEIQVYDVEFIDTQTYHRLSLEGNIYQLGDYGNPNL